MIPHCRLDNRGATAAEFALIIPAFLLLLGAIQVGTLFFAYTGLQNAVADGAREATLHPRRTDQQIRARIAQSRFGLDPAKLADPVIARGSNAGQDFVDVTLVYNTEINVGAFTIPSIRVRQTRRAYLP